MRNRYKTALVAALIVFALCVSYITVDCIRLRNAQTGTKPLITLSETVTDTRTTYTGLGYTVQYYTDIGDVTQNDGTTYVEQLGYGAEFRLFGKLLVWAWVE